MRYASWIRILKANIVLLELELQTFQLFSLSGPLCPNIQELDWSGRTSALPFLPLFIAPGIRSLSISVAPLDPGDVSDGELQDEALAEIIPRLDPSILVKLDISLSSGVQDRVSSLVLRCGPALVSLTVSIPFSEQALLHVITLPNLRQLSVRNQLPPNIPESTDILPSLETLDLSGIPHSQWISFLNNRYTANEPTTPHSTLQTLVLHDWGGLGSSTVSQVLTFTNLKTLNIRESCVVPDDGPCAFNLADRDITHLAVALPHLTYLHLGQVRCKRTVCKITFRSFLSLSARCSELSHLATHISTKTIVQDVETLLGTEDPEMRALLQSGRCRLESLDVGSTPLSLPSRSDLELVAKVFSYVFPMLERIFVRREPRGRESEWNRLMELISKLKDYA